MLGLAGLAHGAVGLAGGHKKAPLVGGGGLSKLVKYL